MRFLLCCKKDKAEVQEHVDRYDELRIVLFARCDEYPKIEAEIKLMLEEDGCYNRQLP